MSEPGIEWFVEKIDKMLDEIDNLVAEELMTNSKREIIYFNTNQVKIDLHVIMRKLKYES